MGEGKCLWSLVLGMGMLMATPAGWQNDEVVALLEKPAPTRQPACTSPHEVGRASWYGEQFHSLPTASGEEFDMFELTAAHPKLPLGTRIRVTHLRSHRSVTVRVNDRGPFRAGVVIDLSYEAARQLGIVEQGLARVSLDVLSKPVLCREEAALAASGV